MNDPVPTPVRALLDVYAAELPEVRFPDVDLEVLKTTLTELEQQTEAVAKAEEELAAAKKAQLESFEALVAKSRRALSYAKVYAEDKPELLAKLDAIGLKVPKSVGAKPKEAAAEAKREEKADKAEAPKEPATRQMLAKPAAEAEEPDEAEVEEAATAPSTEPKKRGRPPKAKNGHAEAR